MSIDAVDRLNAALSGRYRIERELGEGGMATVYLADDIKHERKVALKVLKPELAAVVGAERFLAEIKTTANLQHPHILPLFDSGEADGFLFYVMPYVEGETLGDRLEREKQLPVDEAVRIATDVAEALEAAHHHGVIHRDIKPANILLSRGRPLVADFGIALAVSAAGGGRLTETGLSMGTPYYMSPEQASADRDPTAASDVYSLGCVLYEMLVGEPPYTGASAQAVLVKILTGDAPAPTEARPSIPANVDGAIRKALETLAADRFTRAQDFARALADPGFRHGAPSEVGSGAGATRAWRWVAAGLGVTTLALTLAVGWSVFAGAGSDSGAGAPSVGTPTGSELTYLDLAEDPRPTIAVLPFADMSPDGDQEYFSDGISLEIQTMLSKIRNLLVAGRSSAFAYKGRDLDMRQVGEELGVDYLLDGTVRKDGDQLRINVELVSASRGLSVWTASYDRRLENIFAIQTEIAEAIADSLRIPLGLSPEELVSPTLDMEAHDLYLSGRAALRRRGPGVGEAVRLFEAAVARDSMWAPAWAGLAEASAINPLYTGLGSEYTDSAIWAGSFAVAGAAARRALELDPRNAAARVALGGVHRDRWEWAEGEQEFLRALELDPDSEEAHTQYAELLWGMGRLDESLRESGRALALDRSPIRLDVEGFVLYMNGRLEEAEAMLEEGLALDSAGDVHYLRTVLANLMLVDGRYQEAVDRFASYLSDPAVFRLMGEALEAGDPTLLGEVEGTSRGLPQVWVLLGEPERALDVLEEMAFALPFRVLFDIWDPIMAPIWHTPRFQDVILPRVRLEGAAARYAAPSEPPSG